jgi:PKD repeat protein
MMVAAWEPSPKEAKPKPAAIPPEAFGANAVLREAAGPPTTRGEKNIPDFLLNVTGCVPLPDNPLPLVGVQFEDASPKALLSGAKHVWDFGDGQTSDKANPVHVYLRPGLYRVKLSLRRAGRPIDVTNRVYVDQPRIENEKNLPTLANYLPALESYDARTLDAAGLRQWIAAYQALADAVVADAEEKLAKSGATDAEARREPMAAAAAASAKYIAAAVEAARVALVEGTGAKGDEDLMALARLAGPMARDQLGDPRIAGTIWMAASKRVSGTELRGECQMEAADVAINDLSDTTRAKPLLDSATTALPSVKSGQVASRLKRVWGDYYAQEAARKTDQAERETGDAAAKAMLAAKKDGEAARKAYREAESLVPARRNAVERVAWQGARGRSTEQYLKTGEYGRAIAEIRQWQDEYPADKVNGYLTLLYARYWTGRGSNGPAIALAGQLAAVNGDSPYIDQLLMLAAECYANDGTADRAIATLERVLKAYPGSPWVPAVKERLEQIQKGDLRPKRKKPAKA